MYISLFTLLIRLHCRFNRTHKAKITINRLAVPYEYQFVCFHDNVIKLASKLNHNCDNLAGATSRETFPPINLQNISVSRSRANFNFIIYKIKSIFPYDAKKVFIIFWCYCASLIMTGVEFGTLSLCVLSLFLIGLIVRVYLVKLWCSLYSWAVRVGSGCSNHRVSPSRGGPWIEP